MNGPADAVRLGFARWWRPLVAVAVAVVLLGASAVSSSRRDAAVSERLVAATSFARVRIGGLLATELAPDEVSTPLGAGVALELTTVLGAELETHPEVARVRIWSSQSVVVFAFGDRADETLSPPGGPSPIAEALDGDTVARATVEPVVTTAGAPSSMRIWETWLPLRVGGSSEILGVAEVDQLRDPLVAGVGDEAGTLATAFRWLALGAFVVAVAFALVTARRLRSPRQGPRDADAERPAPPPDPAAPGGEDAELAIAEVARERDVSIARADEAEERERLVRDRLTSLEPLEERVALAERRALDAERRLDEVIERVEAAGPGDDGEPPDDPDRRERDPGDATKRHSAELRARLARAAARRKPPPDA